MREEKLEIEVSPEGIIRTIYSDDLHEMAFDMDAKFVDVQRASNVEWTFLYDREGWFVSSAWDPLLAIRTFNDQVFVARSGDLVVFPTREKALEMERKFFWDLLPPKKKLDLRAQIGDKP